MNYAGPSNHRRFDFNCFPGNVTLNLESDVEGVTNQGSKSKSDIMTNTPNVTFTTSLFTTYKMSPENARNNPEQLNAHVFKRQKQTNASELNSTQTCLGRSGNDEVRNESVEAKSTRTRNKMYYCEFCDTCATQKSRTGLKCHKDEIHYSGECVWISSVFCSICGLKFTDETYQGHKANHKKYKLEFEYKFYRWQDEKPLMKAPVPRYPYCVKCKVFYLPQSNTEHIHSQSKRKCDICKKVYDDFTYKLHMNFHKTNVSSNDDINLDSKAGKPSIDKSENISIGPQGETVIDFFRCKICAATYHIKGYVGRHKCDTPLRHCKQCNMHIPAPHYKKHSELHDRYNNTNCRGTITEF